MRTVEMGLIAGLTLRQTLRMPPGVVLDLFVARREYDMFLHQLKSENEEDGDLI